MTIKAGGNIETLKAVFGGGGCSGGDNCETIKAVGSIETLKAVFGGGAVAVAVIVRPSRRAGVSKP